MKNFDEQIEEYKKALLEFSKNCQDFPEEELPEAVPVISQNVENTTDEPKEEIESPVISDEAPPNRPVEISAYETYDNYDDFIAKNGSNGKMKIQVTAGQTIPVSNAKTDISVTLRDEERTLFTGYTDIDGIVDNINLPAPAIALSLDENNSTVPFSVYNIKITHPDYAPAEYRNAPVFESVKSIQPVNLVPLTENGDEPGRTVYDEQPMVLYGGES
ncbi:MAG: hypothetical protein KBT46_07940 [Ruminococcus sp.]|nr:hypothetical protein [Candidatus Copronaster equi]